MIRIGQSCVIICLSWSEFLFTMMVNLGGVELMPAPVQCKAACCCHSFLPGHHPFPAWLLGCCYQEVWLLVAGLYDWIGRRKDWWWARIQWHCCIDVCPAKLHKIKMFGKGVFNAPQTSLCDHSLGNCPARDNLINACSTILDGLQPRWLTQWCSWKLISAPTTLHCVCYHRHQRSRVN